MSATLILACAQWWLTIGAFVAAVFLTFGIDRIDEDARGAYVFRPLLIPGILLIWPLVLWRWFRLETGEAAAARYRPPRAAHLAVSILMALAIAVAVFLGLGQRQSWPAEFEPQQLSAPET